MAEAPQKKNTLEQLKIRQKTERIWRGRADVGSLWNRPIRLKIYVTDYWLYSFRFAYAAAD